MTSFELQSFAAMLQAGTPQEAFALSLKTPVVVSESLWPEFAEWLKNQPEEMQTRGAATLRLLPVMLAEGIKYWNRYPFGPGPLDEILQRTLNGEIDEPQASIMAGAPEVVRNLSGLYVRARMMQFVLEAINGNWRKALLGHRVILAALSARKGMLTRDQRAMEGIAAIEYAAVAKQAVWETADGRFLTDAVARVKAILCQDLQPWHTPGAAEYALGQVHLDPYISGRSSANFQSQMDAWMRRPIEALGVQMTPDLARAIAVPSPLDAFTLASQHFLASANLENGAARGLSLKGYMEAELWKKVAGGAMADLRTAAVEAKTLLAEDQYTEMRAAIDSILQFAGQTQPQAATDWKKTASELLACNAEQMAAQRGLTPTTELMIRVSEAVQNDAPSLALGVWRRALPLMLRREETALNGFLQNGLLYITNGLADFELEKWQSGAAAAAGSTGASAAAGPAKTSLEGGKEALRRAQVGHWSDEKLIATLLSLALRSQLTNGELEGIQLVEMAESVSPSLATEWRPVFAWLTAMLCRSEGANQFAANNYADTMRVYAQSSLCFLEAHLPAQAMEMLDMGADLVNRSHPLLNEFAVYFGIVIPELERQGGNSAVARVRDLGRAFFPLTMGDSHAGSVSFLLSAILKGVLLGAAWEAGGDLQWIDSLESRDLLQAIAKSRAVAPGGGILKNIGGLTMDDLLTVFAEDTELAAGAGPDSTLHNLEVRYDQELRRHMSERRPQQVEWRPAPAEIQNALGPETVLIDYYSGNLPNGNAGLYVHIVTHESAGKGIVDFGIPGMQVELGTGNFLADILALSVSALRTAIQQTPEKGDVSAEGQKSLDTCAYVKSGIEKILSKFREDGKWHLCIVPHGPLHFLPFHLLPYGAGLLGDEWAVTYLPALGLLNPGRIKTPARQSKIAGFGIDFKSGVPHGLPEILGAEEEARMIAAVYGEQAFTGPAATEPALTAALLNAQRVHVSTHGLLTVSAPSFQRVYLSPDQQSDGILYAWELLRLNLRGLDLLTLSACETALGRVDKGDNLRSLAANALIAGANTVIGTLWPVRSGVTQLFFESLYRELATGSGKREAFQTAQLTARGAYPEYRDWGAFWYSGLW